MSLLNDDRKKYPNKGLEALAKVEPKLVKERFGYSNGKNVVDTLNESKRAKLFGIETAINEAMLDLDIAKKNNNSKAFEMINDKINELDLARIELQNSLKSERENFSFGGIAKKILKTLKIDVPKNANAKDIDDILDSLTPAQMEKLSPIEREQLLDLQLEKYGVDGKTSKDIDEILDELTPAEMDKLSPIEREQLLDLELEKYGIDGRKSKVKGGLLSDDRQNYSLGKIVKKALEIEGVQKNVPGADALYDYIEFKQKFPKKYRDQVKVAEDELEMLNKKQDKLRNQLDSAMSKKGLSFEEMLKDKDFKNLSNEFDKNSKLMDSVKKELKELGINPRKEMEEGGMLPDNEMEDEYLDFILDEALDSEEENYLMEQLQSNDRLSEIFDKVIDIAQEFAGSGPVEGPGSGVSDSIPARLSDGEFVFTAKAVEEIGSDKLMSMMKDAEARADERQGLANGGEPEERVELPVEEQKEPQVRVVKETVDNGGKGIEDEDEISKGIKSKMMLDPDQRHVRS